MIATSLITGVALIGATPAVAATAAAATLKTNRACYVESGHMRITGSGFPAGSVVQISPVQDVFGGMANTTVATDGTFTTKTRAPTNDTDNGPITRTITLLVHVLPPLVPGQASPEIIRRLPVHTVNPGVSATRIHGATGPRPSERRFTFADFRPRHEIYGYYLRNWSKSSRHNTAARVAFGRAHGPCGVLHTTARLVPRRLASLARRDLYFGIGFTTRHRYSPRSAISYWFANDGTRLGGGGFGRVTTDPGAGPALALPNRGFHGPQLNSAITSSSIASDGRHSTRERAAASASKSSCPCSRTDAKYARSSSLSATSARSIRVRAREVVGIPSITVTSSGWSGGPL